MSPRGRKQADPIERAIETALSPGSFINSVRELADGGTWNTIAGQPTDDSEMALSLARTLADQGWYDPEKARKAYIF